MTRSEVIVGGFDLASVSSGVTYVRGVWERDAVTVEPVYEKAYTIKNTFPSRYAHAQLMIKDSCMIKEKHGLDLCVIEDYINASYSMVSFSMGEFGGLVRGTHFAAGFSILLNRPVIMRSFIANSRPIPKGIPGKRMLTKWAEEDFGFVSKQKKVKERSDCSDAFLHAVIGVYTLFFLQGAPLSLLSEKRQETWTHAKKQNGILDNLENRLCTPEACEI